MSLCQIIISIIHWFGLGIAFIGIGRFGSCEEKARYVYWKHWASWSSPSGITFFFFSRDISYIRKIKEKRRKRSLNLVLMLCHMLWLGV